MADFFKYRPICQGWMQPWQIFSTTVQYANDGCHHDRFFQISSNTATMDATMADVFKYCPICQLWMPPWHIFSNIVQFVKDGCHHGRFFSNIVQ